VKVRGVADFDLFMKTKNLRPILEVENLELAEAELEVVDLLQQERKFHKQ
jgi:hypothetical protein